MKIYEQIRVTGLLIVTAGLLFAFGCGQSESAGKTASAGETSVVSMQVVREQGALPRLLDLGAHKCKPCQMMAPILDDLKANHADSFETVFIDVWENPAAGQKHGVQSIPTQIFFDKDGKELFRHVGFISKEDILAKWKELGVE